MTAAERAALVEAHSWIVAQFVAQYGRRANGADLEQAGLLGLCEAARRFEKGKGVQFRTYAWNWVKGAVLEEIRTAHVVPMSKRAALGKTLAPVTAPRVVEMPWEDAPDADATHYDHGRRRQIKLGLFVAADGEATADAPRRQRIARARVSGLPTPDHRRVAFRALRGRSVEQIAQALEMPPGRVVRLLGEAEAELGREAA